MLNLKPVIKLGEVSYERCRWLRLVDSKGKLKCESSDAADIEQFYEEGDIIEALYDSVPTKIWVEVKHERN